MSTTNPRLSLRAQRLEQRRNAILDYCAMPRSINDIAEHVGANYYTARRDIQDLVASQLVRVAAGNGPNGEMLFVTGSERPMPTFYYKDKQVTLQDLAVVVGSAPDVPSSVRAVRFIFHSFANLGFWGAAEHEVKEKDLQDLKRSLAKAATQLEEIVLLAKAAHANANLWNPDTLQRIREDETFNEKALRESFSSVLQFINSVDVTVEKEQDDGGPAHADTSPPA